MDDGGRNEQSNQGPLPYEWRPQFMGGGIHLVTVSGRPPVQTWLSFLLLGVSPGAQTKVVALCKGGFRPAC